MNWKEFISPKKFHFIFLITFFAPILFQGIYVNLIANITPSYSFDSLAILGYLISALILYLSISFVCYIYEKYSFFKLRKDKTILLITILLIIFVITLFDFYCHKKSDFYCNAITKLENSISFFPFSFNGNLFHILQEYYFAYVVKSYGIFFYTYITDVLSEPFFFLINLAYYYLISCLIIWIYHKIKKK